MATRKKTSDRIEGSIKMPKILTETEIKRMMEKKKKEAEKKKTGSKKK